MTTLPPRPTRASTPKRSGCSWSGRAAGFALIIFAVLAFAVRMRRSTAVLGPLLGIAALQIVAAAGGMVALQGARRASARSHSSSCSARVRERRRLRRALHNLYATSTMSLLGVSCRRPSCLGVWPQVMASTVIVGAAVARSS